MHLPRSQVWITGDSDSTALPTLTVVAGLLVLLAHGAPPVHFSNMRLVGRLKVEDSKLWLTRCSIEPVQGSTSVTERALSITGGRVKLVQSVLSGHPAGAIGVDSAHLILVECVVRDSRARTGGAIRISGSSSLLESVLSNFTNNTAFESGGALQVPGCSTIMRPLTQPVAARTDTNILAPSDFVHYPPFMITGGRWSGAPSQPNSV